MIKSNWGFDFWEQWRWLNLYQVPVHDVLQTNMSEIKKLYQEGRKPQKKFLDLDDCQIMFAVVDGVGPHQI